MLAYLFVVIVLGLRFLFAPLAFAPVAPVLLYFGARQPRRRMWIPLAMLLATDVLLTKLVYGYALTADHLVTWAWYAGVLLLGGLLSNGGALRVAGAALGSSVSFFLLSNFAVWLSYDTYAKNLAGLAACYVAAIPFFRNQLASDAVFTAVLFGTPALVRVVREAMKPAGVRAA